MVAEIVSEGSGLIVSVEEIKDPKSGQLLHQIGRLKRDSSAGLQRFDFSAPEEFLQVAIISIPPVAEFRPHVHLERQRQFDNLRAQESWVVISGEVEVHYYSESGIPLATRSLGPGDVSISYRGGHGYTTKDLKSGPYEGQAVDKRFI
jgi:hypothetical protein